MNWMDIASIVFVCVTMNHLGLIGKLEEIMGKLPIFNCPKCSSFWVTLPYCLWGICHGYGDIITSLAISFLASYLAIWLELFEGYVDTIYLMFYEKIYKTSDDTSASDSNGGNPAGSVS
jgi:hypothetical protein